MKHSNEITRIIVLLLAYGGAATFVRGLFFVLWAGFVTDTLAASLLFLLPYFLITAIFGGAILLAHCRRVRKATVVLMIGLVGSLTMYSYDITHYRYQIHSMGHGKIYLIWWWYQEPY